MPWNRGLCFRHFVAPNVVIAAMAVEAATVLEKMLLKSAALQADFLRREDPISSESSLALAFASAFAASRAISNASGIVRASVMIAGSSGHLTP